ncbi:MAG: hypothetical protein K0Q75_2500 [Anaerospora sp.]|nr:hypothetical protein [Anaerospora sp.]
MANFIEFLRILGGFRFISQNNYYKNLANVFMRHCYREDLNFDDE